MANTDVINVTVTGMTNNTDRGISISGDLSAETIADTIDPVVPSDALTSPVGGEIWSGTHEITWDQASITDSHFNATPIKLYYSSNNGASWNLIASGEANDGTYSWDTTTQAGADGDQYLINITATAVSYTHLTLPTN